MAQSSPLTVVETPDFIAATRKLMTDDERSLLIDYLAIRPLAGDLIPGSGGVRKLRWALKGRGKRGGARVIYYFHSENIPLYALDVFAKNERADLDREDVNRLRRVVKSIAEAHAKKGGKS